MSPFEKEIIEMKPLAKNPRSIRSGVREIMELAWATPECIHLEVGQPDFDTPSHIIQAACQAAWSGHTRYTPNAGIPSLREAIVRKLARRNGIDATVENITVTPGAVSALATSLLALAEPGDEVLIPDPAWPDYEMMALCQNVTPVQYPLDPQRGFQPDIDGIAAAITDRTKVLFVNTPSNPSGAVFPERTLRALLHLASERDLYVLSDEMYEDILFEGKHVSMATLDPEGRVLTVSGVSKNYAMTGWRIGYVVAPQEISQVITRIQEPYGSCCCAVSQKAAEAALDGPQDCVREMVRAYHERRDAVLEILKEHDLYTYTPQGTFYLMVDISRSGMDSYTFARRLVPERKVAVAPGEAFGTVARNYVRISLATEIEDLKEGVQRLCAYIMALPRPPQPSEQ